MGYFAVLTLAGTALGIGGKGAAGANNGLIGVAAAMLGDFGRSLHYYYHLFTQDPASISSAADSNNYGNCGCNYCGDFVFPHDGNSTHRHRLLINKWLRLLVEMECLASCECFALFSFHTI